MARAQSWTSVVGFVWGIRDEILRYHYERHQVGDVILPLVVLRRLDLVLAPTKERVLDKAKTLKGSLDSHNDLLCHQSGHAFYNTSRYDFESLVTSDPEAIKDNFLDYLNGFSPNVRDIVAKFGFLPEVDHMDDVGILLRVLGKFADPKIDLSPEHMSTMDMGYLYEELLRLSSDLSNKEAGDHFTPREVIRLMTSLLVSDTPDVHKPGRVFTVYDPTAGTGGMLTEAEHRLLELNPEAKVYLFGQEILKKTWAVCSSDMLIKGQEASNIVFGDTLEVDGFPGRRFDYVIANPPYGSDWSGSMTAVKKEHGRGFAGRFGAGLPAKSDGQLLFVQHMLAKAKTADEGGGRIAVVLNESPLFSGDAGSGESNIRKWLIENDYVEAIIGLPDQLFYNTNIYTWIWLLTTSKAPERQGRIQLINGREFAQKMAKSLGHKRNELTPEHIQTIIGLHDSFAEGPHSRIFSNEDFGYTRITVEQPQYVRYEFDPKDAPRICGLKSLEKLAPHILGQLSSELESSAPWATHDATEAATHIEAWLGGIKGVTKQMRTAVLASLTHSDPSGSVLMGKSGPVPDPVRRDLEVVPLTADVDTFMKSEVLPFRPDAWSDRANDRTGYEIPFTQTFYTYPQTRELNIIDADMRENQTRILDLLKEVSGT